MIPNFDRNGNLPPGIHRVSWDEFARHYGTTEHRRNLLLGLRRALRLLAYANCQTVYVDGSFVTRNPRPNDFDACWDEKGIDYSLLDRIFHDKAALANGRAEQKQRFQGELFPASWPALRIASGHQIRYLDFFQIDKETKKEKGIIAIDPRSVT